MSPTQTQLVKNRTQLGLNQVDSEPTLEITDALPVIFICFLSHLLATKYVRGLGLGNTDVEFDKIRGACICRI